MLYCCNNGGAYEVVETGGILVPRMPSPHYAGSGRIERIDPATGAVDVLYTACDRRPLRAPNDLVFSRDGTMWFTDHGLREERSVDRTAVFWARPDGSVIREVAFPLERPNGIGLSPDGSRLYVSETPTRQVWWWDVAGPGELVTAPGMAPHGGTLLAGLPDLQRLDSLAVDSEGHVCVATLSAGGITRISPDGAERAFFPCGDVLTTNICWGGEDLRTAYVTLSGSGRLAAFEWPVPGLAPAYAA